MEKAPSLHELPPHIRARALVGYYLQSWAYMEADLNEAVGDALGLSNLQRTIVCKNMQLSNKLHVLKCVLTLEFHPNSCAEDLKALDAISKLSADRNMIAHDMFFDDDKGNGVKFLVMKAKGKLSYPETRWSIDDFLERIKRLHELAKVITQIGKRLATRNLAPLDQWPPGAFSGTNALAALGFPKSPMPSSQDE